MLNYLALTGVVKKQTSDLTSLRGSSGPHILSGKTRLGVSKSGLEISAIFNEKVVLLVQQTALSSSVPRMVNLWYLQWKGYWSSRWLW